MTSSQRRIVLAGGGTAGHVFPALAVAEAYAAAVADLDVLFVGTEAGSEARLVRQHGHRFAAIPGAPVFGVGPRGKVQAASELMRSVLAARRLLRRERAQLVVGFGGYASAGAVLAARSLRLPSAIVEPNAVAGLTNRVLGRFADRVYLGLASARRGLGRPDAEVTGTPVRASLRGAGEARGRQVRDGRAVRVLVTGGSLGSPCLNERAPAALGLLAQRGVALDVRHQSGARPLDAVAAAYRAAGVEARIEEYIDDIAAAYAWADVALTCAGAVTVAELAAVALPALLVPYAGAARDHQRPNARAFAEASGLPWMSESEWRDDAAADAIESLLRDGGAVARLRALARPDAAERVVRDCERLLAARPARA